MDEIEKLKRRIEALEKALAPVAFAADEADEYEHEDDTQAPLSCGDCRKARSVLDEGLTDS